MTQLKIKQIWKKKASGDKVKVIKLFSDEAKVMDIDGPNQGKQYMVKNYQFNNVDYILIRNA